MSALSQLIDKMNSDKYYLTDLIYSSTKKCNFGYKGFMITSGVWYKLRVYYCYVIPENVTISKPDIFEYNTKEEALAKVKELS